jgi:2-C-methyl-D-erythritol 2,4-cyclodiphosphate synthase
MKRSTTHKSTDYRTGIGYDVHAFAECRGRACPAPTLVLGGVTIPYEKGLKGHSDADVLLHAVADALLGAAGKGDIGEHFPDTDKRFKGASSLRLLEQVRRVIEKAGFKVANVDCTLLAEKPKISPHKKKMCKNIARALNVDVERVNVKATTNEGLGFVGRKEGMAAYATALLRFAKY